MSNIYSTIPKKIKLIVNKAEDLQLYHPKKSLIHQPQKWRVYFLNVEEKMATAKVESVSGNPEWLCEITVTAKNGQDPIALLVTDSKGRHIGQVIIQLNQVPPLPSNCVPGTRPPLVISDIRKSELEPTKKNPYPRGYLFYWIWAVDYWKSAEIIRLKKKRSLSMSMLNLSNSTLNLFRRKKSDHSYQESGMCSNKVGKQSVSYSGLRASPLKVNTLKNRLKSGSNPSPMIAQCDTIPNSPVYNVFFTKKSFEIIPADNISLANVIKQEESYQPGPSSSQEPSFHHQTSTHTKDSPVLNRKKYGLFNKLKYKKSQSTADLSIISVDKEVRNVSYTLPQSLGKLQGQHIFEKNNDFSRSSTDLASWFSDEKNTHLNNNEPHRVSKRMNRPQSCMIRNPNDLALPNQVTSNHNDIKNLSHKSYSLSRDVSFLHGEAVAQIRNKNLEDMTKRELIDLANLLDNQLNKCTERCKMTERETEKVKKEKDKLHDDLSNVKDELCRLKLQLLEAGDTKYLEKNEPKNRADVFTDLTLWRANTKI